MTDEQLDELRGLAVQLLQAKQAEAEAKAKRIELEEAIAAIVEGPEKGQKTFALPGKGKVTVERGFNYKADVNGIGRLFAKHPGSPPPIRTKTTRELDVAGYEWYRENCRELFHLISEHVEVRPKKVAVSVKGL